MAEGKQVSIEGETFSKPSLPKDEAYFVVLIRDTGMDFVQEIWCGSPTDFNLDEVLRQQLDSNHLVGIFQVSRTLLKEALELERRPTDRATTLRLDGVKTS